MPNILNQMQCFGWMEGSRLKTQNLQNTHSSYISFIEDREICRSLNLSSSSGKIE